MTSRVRKLLAVCVLLAVVVCNFFLPLSEQHRVGISSGIVIVFLLAPFGWFCLKLHLTLRRQRLTETVKVRAQRDE